MNELTLAQAVAVFDAVAVSDAGRAICCVLDRRGVAALLKWACGKRDAQSDPCPGLVSTCHRLRGLLDTKGWTSAQVSMPPDARQHGLTVAVTWAKPAARRGLTPMQKWQRNHGARR